MAKSYDRGGMSTTTVGQGTVSLGSALGAAAINVASFQSFASGGAQDGDLGTYLFLDSNGNWELSRNTYNAAGTTLSGRTVLYSSNSNTAINLSGNAQVFSVAAVEDIVLYQPPATIPAAATTDLSTTRSPQVTISGTTTITSLGGGASLIRFVTFTGVLTLTYNATTLILPGAANITTAAGDAAIFVSNAAGNWTCLSYQGATSLLIISTSLSAANKKTFGVNIATTTTDDASPGGIGEFVNSSVVQASATGISNGVAQNITSINLTAGDWDVYGTAAYLQAASTNITRLGVSIGTTTNTYANTDTLVYGENGYVSGTNLGVATVPTVKAGPVRFSLGSTTTIYLVGFAAFTASTMQVYGSIRARRVR